MIVKKPLIFCLVLYFSIITAATSFATTNKVALVIGNSEYQNTEVLPNPQNDASALAEKLKSLDFDVIHVNNANALQTRNVIKYFNDKISDKKIGLFFYAGHGISINGMNYLIPVDATLNRATAIKNELIKTESILSASRNGEKTILVFLDACRNNPFKENLTRIEGLTVSRGLSVTKKVMGESDKGLSRFNSGNKNLFISFATQPGNVAVDGLDGEKHSPFSEAIIDNIDQKLEVRELMTRVRSSVAERTAFAQIPWEQNSLLEQIYLAGQPDLGKLEVLHVASVSRINKSWGFIVADTVSGQHPKVGELLQIDLDGKIVEGKVGKVMEKSISVIPASWDHSIYVGAKVVKKEFRRK